MRSRQSRQKAPELPSKLARAQRRIERWRATRERRTIPEELWTEAVELAREYGLHRTSRALRLNYYSLKRRVDSEVEHSDEPPVFVDVSPFDGGVGRAGEGFVDLVDPRGLRVRIEWRGELPSGLSAVTAAFLGDRP